MGHLSLTFLSELVKKQSIMLYILFFSVCQNVVFRCMLWNFLNKNHLFLIMFIFLHEIIKLQFNLYLIVIYTTDAQAIFTLVRFYLLGMKNLCFSALLLTIINTSTLFGHAV